MIRAFLSLSLIHILAENKNAQQVREITDKLEQGIKELFESERFKEYLRTMSKFYNYSFNNTLLIAMQKPCLLYTSLCKLTLI